MITVCCSAVVGCSCSCSAADNSSNPQYVRVPRRMEDVVFSVNRRLLAAKQKRCQYNFAEINICNRWLDVFGDLCEQASQFHSLST